MKPCLLLLSLFLLQSASSQSLDYISVRKKNGRVVKNVYAGSRVLLQTADGAYLEGPVKAIRNDSLFLLLYDVRRYPTPIGSVVLDTVSLQELGLHHRDIRRIHFNRRRGFFERQLPTLLMIAGAGYVVLNTVNGAMQNGPVSEGDNLRKLGWAAGAFGLGYVLQKLFASDGFSKKGHRIVYVDL